MRAKVKVKAVFLRKTELYLKIPNLTSIFAPN